MAATTPTAVREALRDVDYPASKDDLLASACRNNASDEVDRALRAVPPVVYENLAEVLASVHTDDEPPEVTARLQAQRRREHAHPGLAERAKDTS